MAERYNRLYNRVSENPIWTQLSPAVFKVFCGCLMKANYRDSKWYDGIAEIPVKRGSFITSRERLAEFCHVSPQQARDALEHLERLHVITRQGTNRYTVVTFCNYEQYNSFETASEPAEEPAKNPAENPSGTKEEPKRNQVGTTVVTNTTRTTRAADNTSTPSADAEVLAVRRPSISAMQEQTFQRFWGVVWAKIGRGAAWKAWKAQIRDLETAESAITAAKQQSASLIAEAMARGHSVVHPATWINAERWTDEPVLALTVNGTPSAQRTFSERNEEIRNRKFMERMAEDLTNG